MGMGSTYEIYNKNQLLAILRARDEEIVDLQKATEALVQQIETMRILFKRLTKEHEENTARQREELTSRFEEEREQLLANIADAKSSAAAAVATRANNEMKSSLLQDKIRASRDSLVNLSSSESTAGANSSSDLKDRFAALEVALHNERMGRAADQTALVAVESDRSQLRQLLNDNESRSKSLEAALRARDDEIDLLKAKRRSAGEPATYTGNTAAAEEERGLLQTVTTATTAATTSTEEEVLTPPVLPQHFLFLGLHVSEEEMAAAAATTIAAPNKGKVAMMSEENDAVIFSSSRSASARSHHREGVLGVGGAHVKGGGVRGGKEQDEEDSTTTEAPPPLFLVIKDTIAPAATDARVKPGDVLIAATVRKTYVFNADAYRAVVNERRRIHSERAENERKEGSTVAVADRLAATGGRRSGSAGHVKLEDDVSANYSHSHNDEQQRAFSSGIGGREQEERDDDYNEGYPKGIGMSLDRAASASTSALTRPSPSPPPPHPRGRALDGLLAQRSSSSQSQVATAVLKRPKQEHQPDVVVYLPTTGSKKRADVGNQKRSSSARSDGPSEIQPLSSPQPHLGQPSPLAVYEQLINELSLYAQVELTIGRRNTTSAIAAEGEGVHRGASPPSGERVLVTTLKPFYPMVAEF